MIDLVDMKAYEYDADGNCTEIPIPDDLAEQAQEYREKLMDEVAENSEALMERYLEGEDISHDEIVHALEEGTDTGHIFPVTCGVATTPPGRRTGCSTRSSTTSRHPPSTSGSRSRRASTLEPDPEGEMFAYVFKTRADPFAGRINLFRVYQGTMTHDTQVHEHPHPSQGACRPAAGAAAARTSATPTSSARATSARWPSSRRRTPATGSRRATSRSTCRAIKLPAPVMAFAMEPKNKGDEDKVHTALRRLQEEDPTIDLHRDEQTGEQIVAGLSQIHVEVIIDRMKSRFGAEVTLKPPRVPYQETIRGTAKAHGRHKKQTGGRGQFGDCHIEVEPLPDGEFEFVNAIKGGVDPARVHPGGREGRARGDAGAAPWRASRSRA